MYRRKLGLPGLRKRLPTLAPQSTHPNYRFHLVSTAWRRDSHVSKISFRKRQAIKAKRASCRGNPLSSPCGHFQSTIYSFSKSF